MCSRKEGRRRARKQKKKQDLLPDRYAFRIRSNKSCFSLSYIEVTGNRQIYVSPAARVEQIGPGKGIRYTAMIKGGNRLKNGEAVFHIEAMQGNGRFSSGVQEIAVPTRR